MIHLFRPSVGRAEAQAAGKAIRSRWLGPGPCVQQFEKRLGDYLGVEVTTIACATDGLFLSMELLGIGRGDEVVVPDIHFVGAASAVYAAGAKVVLCDVDPLTLNASADDVRRVMTPKTRAIMALHYGGHLCHIEDICDLGVPVVEDAALALGSGGGTYGDIGIWSFDAMKTITTGGSGGAIYVRAGAERARRLTRLGLSQQHGVDSQAYSWWQYTFLEPGRLSEMNDVQAAVGLVQMDRLEGLLEKRRDLCDLYTAELCGYVQTPLEADAPSFYWIQTPRRDALARHLRARGIYTSFKYWPLHLALGVGGHFPGAEYAANNTLLLPLHGELSKRQVRRICREIRGFLTNERGES